MRPKLTGWTATNFQPYFEQEAAEELARRLETWPEMLEALKGLLPHVIGHTKMNCLPSSPCKRCIAEGAAKRVIAKVKAKP